MYIYIQYVYAFPQRPAIPPMPEAEQPARLAEVGLEELQRQIAESEGSPRPQGRRVGLGPRSEVFWVSGRLPAVRFLRFVAF